MRKVVGVLRGGPSREYEVSLKTGASVLEALDREQYEPRDIFIDREGAWHVHGVAMEPERALKGIDVAFNAMHGEYGEDGRVQRELDKLGVPYTGSGAFASAIAYNKQHTKEAVKKLGVKVPHGLVLEPAREGEIDELARRLFRTFPHPAIVKPVSGGSSLGTHVAHTYHGLEHALKQASAYSPKILIEEYIPGRDASVGVLSDYRNEGTYALIPAPITLTHAEKDALSSIAKKVHDGLGLSHYSESDFVVSKRGIYFLEVNSLPKLHGDSKLMGSLQAVGTSLSQFLSHVVELGHARKAR
ncbi:MAG: ATP-grasp domain-containing protein, partial [Candidatus Pacebacteria bacterium]|nr:ATP-grasp domain-containing protein [Candidatus Paceibacterota bacterium]